MLASNFNYIFCVMSVNNNFNIRRLERLIILTYNTGAKPVVVLSKVDLVDNIKEYVDSVKKVLADIDVITTSIKTKQGINRVKEYLVYPNTILLIGSSGVGKSSLINEILNKEVLKTGEIRNKDDRGKHTTVTRKMIILDNGGKIIDTPGIRSFGMINIEKTINDYYKDVVILAQNCKFKNCTHRSEPGCAIRNELQNGNLSYERYAHYKILIAESIKFKKGNKKHNKYDRNNFKKRTKQIINMDDIDE